MIQHHGQQRGHHATEDRGGVVERAQALEDVVAQALPADRRRQGRGADGQHRGGADAAQDHRRGQRQLDTPQHLPVAHAQPARGFRQRGVHAADADDRVGQDRQHAVEDQGEEGRPEADQAAQQQHHQAEQGQARQRLDDARRRQHPLRHLRAAAGGDAQRQADGQRRHQGADRQQHVAAQVRR